MTRKKRDRTLSLLMAMMFSFALSSLALVVPLVAMRAGYEAAQMGLLVALAAVTQIGTRLTMGWLMRKVADKTLLVTSAMLIALSGVRAACGMNAAAGAWRSLLDSYIPVVLSLAGQPAVVIGLLLTLANGSMLVGNAASSWIRVRGIRASFAAGLLCTGLGLAATAPLATFTVAAAVALATSGLGAGILQTVGPAIAADTVGPEERGDALALTGTYRAVALFLAPVGMAGMLAIAPLAPSLILAGFLISSPATIALRPPQKWRRA